VEQFYFKVKDILNTLAESNEVAKQIKNVDNEELFLANDLITLNIRGKILFTSRSTLLRISNTKLSRLFTNETNIDKLKRDQNGHIYFDYNPILFRQLLIIIGDYANNLERLNGLFRLCSEEFKTFVYQLGFDDYYVNGITNLHERFWRTIGYGAKLDENKRIVQHINKSWWNKSEPIIIGKNLYSNGIARLQFIIEKRHRRMFIGIMSSSFTRKYCDDYYPSVYGWNECLIINGQEQYVDKKFSFTHLSILQGDTIELEINCLDRKIMLLNKRSRINYEILIDLNNCPLPWVLRLRLFYPDDKVVLLNQES
ncbi:unnamed protein product, partial [Didymodactylos carnosus]